MERAEWPGNTQKADLEVLMKHAPVSSCGLSTSALFHHCYWPESPKSFQDS